MPLTTKAPSDTGAVADFLRKVNDKIAAEVTSTIREKLELAANEVAALVKSTNINLLTDSLEEAVEKGALSTHHQSLLLAKLIISLANKGILQDKANVIPFRASSYELRHHNIVIYRTAKHCYLIDSTSEKDSRVFNLKDKTQHEMAIQYYKCRGLDGVLIPLWNKISWGMPHIRLSDIPILSDTAIAALETIRANGIQEVEPELICLLSHSIIKDPVELVKQEKNGKRTSYRFDRQYLTEWLKNHDTNPLTHEKLSNSSYIKANGFQRSSFIQEVSAEERLEAWKLVWKYWGNQDLTTLKMPPKPDITAIMINTELKKYIMRAEKEIKEVRFNSFFCIPIPRKINQKHNCEIARQLSAEIETCLKAKTPINLAQIEIKVRANHKNHSIRSSELNSILKKMRPSKHEQQFPASSFEKRGFSGI